MSFLLNLYPGDRVMALLAMVAVEVAAIVLVVLLLAALTRRRAAIRSAILLSGLVFVLASPLIVTSFDTAGITWFRLPILKSVSTQADAPAADTEFASVPSLSPASGGDKVANHKPDAGVPETDQPSASAAAVTVSLQMKQSDRLRALCGSLVFIWIVGVWVGVGRLAHGYLTLGRLRQDVTDLSGALSPETIEAVRRAFDVRELPRIVSSPRVTGPVAIGGIGKPLVILPEDMLAQLDQRQLRDVLIHECAHLIQNDLIIGLVQRVAEIIFWPHALVYLLNRLLTETREQLCDNYVLRNSDAVGYVRTLIEVARVLPQPPAIVGVCHIAGSPVRLQERIEDLLDEERNLMTRANRLAVPVFAALLLTVSGIIASSSLLEADAKSKVANEKELVVAGRVVDPQGRPVGQAVISTRKIGADNFYC